MPNTLSGTIVASKEVVSREIKGETVLLDLKTENYFGLNDLGARIWQLTADGASLQEMRVVLAAEFDVGEEMLTKDLERFLGDLADAGLVTTGQTEASSVGL